LRAVVLAAGVGRRLNPLTRDRPKPLLPVAGAPLISWTLQALARVYVKDVCLVIGPSGEGVVEALRGFSDLRLSWATQSEPRGTAHALLAAKDYIRGDERFLLLYGDIFFDPSILPGLLSLATRGFDGVVAAVVQEEARRFGVILEDDGLLRGVLEKPSSLSGPALINSGIYILPGRIIEVAERLTPSPRGEYELTDALTRLVEEGARIAVYRHSGYWLDVGTPSSYLRANLLALREGISRGEGCVGEVRLGRGVRVRSTVMMGGVDVGDSASLYSSVLLEGAVVEPGSHLSYTIVGELGRVGRGSRLYGSLDRPVIVGPRSKAPPGTRAWPGDVL